MRKHRAISAAAAGMVLAGTLVSTPLVFAHDGGVAGMRSQRIDQTEIQAMMAEDVDTTVEDLKMKATDGKKPREHAAEIADRVLSGKITQEQADKILERMANHPKPGKIMHGIKLGRFMKHRFSSPQ